MRNANKCELLELALRCRYDTLSYFDKYRADYDTPIFGATIEIMAPFAGSKIWGATNVLAEGKVAEGAAARAQAEAAQIAGRTNGTAAELRIGNEAFTDVSTGGQPRVLNPKVQQALDQVAKEDRSPYHGHCAEPGCISNALDAGKNVSGGSSYAVKIRAEGKAAHGTFIEACSSCQAVLEYFGVVQTFLWVSSTLSRRSTQGDARWKARTCTSICSA